LQLSLFQFILERLAARKKESIITKRNLGVDQLDVTKPRNRPFSTTIDILWSNAFLNTMVGSARA
jgi:hypothetical protein